MVQKKPRARMIWILIDVINPRGIERAGTADDPVHFVPFRKQQLR
jgi:hypothetical protein